MTTNFCCGANMSMAIMPQSPGEAKQTDADRGANEALHAPRLTLRGRIIPSIAAAQTAAM
jgi:hypothetical protein